MHRSKHIPIPSLLKNIPSIHHICANRVWRADTSSTTIVLLQADPAIGTVSFCEAGLGVITSHRLSANIVAIHVILAPAGLTKVAGFVRAAGAARLFGEAASSRGLGAWQTVVGGVGEGIAVADGVGRSVVGYLVDCCVGVGLFNRS